MVVGRMQNRAPRKVGHLSDIFQVIKVSLMCRIHDEVAHVIVDNIGAFLSGRYLGDHPGNEAAALQERAPIVEREKAGNARLAGKFVRGEADDQLAALCCSLPEETNVTLVKPVEATIGQNGAGGALQAGRRHEKLPGRTTLEGPGARTRTILVSV